MILHDEGKKFLQTCKTHKIPKGEVFHQWWRYDQMSKKYGPPSLSLCLAATRRTHINIRLDWQKENEGAKDKLKGSRVSKIYFSCPWTELFFPNCWICQYTSIFIIFGYSGILFVRAASIYRVKKMKSSGWYLVIDRWKNWDGYFEYLKRRLY